MPWQQQVFDIIGELFTPEECEEREVPLGTPAYREIAYGVPRQSGKTTIALAAMVDRCAMWEPYNGIPNKCVYTAQRGSDAREKFLDDFVPLIDPRSELCRPAIRKRVRKVLTGQGAERALFQSGGIIRLAANTEASSHGKTLDLGIVDEAFADADNRRQAGLGPGMATRDWAQRIITSTAGTSSSLYWNKKCEDGRKAVKADTGSEFAYLEWSAPDDAHHLDEDMWRECHPALGYSISLNTLRVEARPDQNDEAEFRRAYLNIPTAQLFSPHIDGDAWAKVCGDHTAIGDGTKRWAVDVAADRSHSAIAVHNIDTSTTELTDYHPGTGWLPERIQHLTATHGGQVVCDGTGPVENLGKEEGWTLLDGAKVTTACADFYDLVIGDGTKIRAADPLDTALAAAEVRRAADKWKWSRAQSSADVSPLIAVTLAAAAPGSTRQPPFILR